MPYPSLQQPIGLPFIELQTVDSSNNYALAQIHAGLARHGMAVFAHEQVAGKGQRGREWISSGRTNIALSIIINPSPLQVSGQFQLSACIAVAARDFLEFYTSDSVKIKWPNDLYWKDRKAGGILIENVISGTKWNWSVIGIGININQVSFPKNLENPVSLKQITGKEFYPAAMAKELCTVIDTRYRTLMEEGFTGILNDYHRHLYKKDEIVKLKKDSRIFEVTVKGISRNGKLIVHHGIEEQYDLGEVKWIT